MLKNVNKNVDSKNDCILTVNNPVEQLGITRSAAQADGNFSSISHIYKHPTQYSWPKL